MKPTAPDNSDGGAAIDRWPDLKGQVDLKSTTATRLSGLLTRQKVIDAHMHVWYTPWDKEQAYVSIFAK